MTSAFWVHVGVEGALFLVIILLGTIFTRKFHNFTKNLDLETIENAVKKIAKSNEEYVQELMRHHEVRVKAVETEWEDQYTKMRSLAGRLSRLKRDDNSSSVTDEPATPAMSQPKTRAEQRAALMRSVQAARGRR